MDDENQLVNEIIGFIEKDFLIDDNNSLIPSTNVLSNEELRKYLTGKLKYLLEEKFDMLVNFLYRIDISEKKLSQLFSGENKNSIPSSLADLIIERQLQKIHLRKLYKEGKL